MKVAGSIWLAATLALAQNAGITPRPSPADYPAHTTVKGMTEAATFIPPEQAKKIFGADVSHGGYVVFEVAIYPEKDRQAEITPADFMLRMGPDGGTMRPSEPSVVAASTIPYGKNQAPTPPPTLPGNVHVYSESTIGYESGPYRRGVYTGGGVIVTNYPPPPPPPPGAPAKDQQRYDLEIALGSKALPAGLIVQPVAGYLYFPKPTTRHRGDPYDLALYLPGESAAHLILKPAN